jgi:ATP-binding cassette subfamily B protein
MQFRAAPRQTAANNLLSIVHALTWTLGVVATQRLFDAITRAAAGDAGFADCLIPLLFLAAVTFGQQILNGIHNFYWSIVEGKAQPYYRKRLFRKLSVLDPAVFENTEFLDDVNKARDGVWWLVPYSMTFLNIFTFYGVFFVSVGFYLWSLKPVLLVTLLAAFIPAVIGQTVRGKVFTKLEEESAPLRRENGHYQSALCDREFFKETRILGGYRFFHRLFTDTLKLLTQKTWKAERKTALLQLALNLLSFAGIAVSAILLFNATMSGEVSIGAFAAVFRALDTVFSIMQEIVNSHLGDMNQNLGKVANYFRVLDMPERVGEPGAPDLTLGITAENVSFTYPGREEPAVKGVTLTLNDGETVAIVGENGAGKSTLVRLLTGLYRPSEGKVTVGGLDTSLTDPSSLYQNTSGVFQGYQRYKMTLAENVEISDTAAGDANRMETVLRDADADMTIPPDTMLSPEFDGIDLSGGQWQRIAIARGLYRSNGFIVLDEPTSAIDPIEETRIYEQFRRLSEGKCAVVVTHRLGSAKLAKKIIVMDGGRIVDIGTHEELLARSEGKYADMWAAQARWYARSS